MEIMCLVQDGIEDMEVMFVGCLPVELDPDDQDVRKSFTLIPLCPLCFHAEDLSHSCASLAVCCYSQPPSAQ